LAVGHEPSIAGESASQSFYEACHFERGRLAEQPQSTPGKSFGALRHDRIGQHGIRIKRQIPYRFVWRAGNAYDVEIVDYH